MKRLFAVFSLGLAALIGLAITPSAAEPIRGAGSTFAAPIIVRWGEMYRKFRMDGGDFASPDWALDYEAVGSVGGMMRMIDREVDFAASDQPMTPDELTKRRLAQFPIVIGGVAVVVNVPGIAPGQLKLSGKVVADIFLGKIKTWNDAQIAALNAGTTLPARDITVVRRQDGSGTTYTFSQYLAGVSDEWLEKVGVNTDLKWPVGVGAEGSSKVVERVRATAGAISYVEYGQVRRANLVHVQVENRAGRFLSPEAAAFQAAANGADWAGARNFYLDLTKVNVPEAYPITAVTYALIPTSPRSRQQAVNVRSLFALALENGGEQAIALGYIPLPARVSTSIREAWAKLY